MRTIGAGNAAQPTSVLTDFTDAIRVEVANATDVLTVLTGSVVSVEYSQEAEAIVDAATIVFRRRSGVDSLAPLMVASPPVALGRRVVISINPGSGAYTEVFRGKITDVDWPERDGDVTVQCLDQAGVAARTWIETARVYSTTGGVSLETVMQAVATDNLLAPVPTLYFPAATAAVVQHVAGDAPYGPTEQSVLDAERALAESIGWTIRWRHFGAGNNEVHNSSFETGIDASWTLYNNGPEAASLVVATAAPFHGVRHARVIWTVPNTSTKGVIGATGNVVFKPLHTYMISWYAKATTAMTLGMETRWNTAPSITTLLNPNVGTAYQRYSFRLVWGATVDPNFFITIISNGGQAANDLDLDGIQIEEGEVLTAYAPKVDELYGAPSSDWRWTVFAPARTKSVADRTFGPSEYWDVTTMRQSDADIRNVITVEYVGAGGVKGSVTVLDTASIAKYGRLYGKITEGSDSPVNDAAQATLLANAVGTDLAEPNALLEITCRYFWPGEIGVDLYTFTGNGVHFSTDQTLAAMAFQHRIAVGERPTTRVLVRGKPSGGSLIWRGRIDAPPISPVPPSPTITQLDGEVNDTVWNLRFAALAGSGGGGANLTYRILAKIGAVTKTTLFSGSATTLPRDAAIARHPRFETALVFSVTDTATGLTAHAYLSVPARREEVTDTGNPRRARPYDDTYYAPRGSDAAGDTIAQTVAEFGGKAVNRLFAKPLAADADTADSVSTGIVRRVTTLNEATGGGRGFGAIDAGNVVVAAGVDFSRAYTGKNLDNVPNTATRFAAAEAGANNTESRTAADVQVGAGKAVLEAGANKTETRTSADTAAVAGTAAATVQSGAARGQGGFSNATGGLVSTATESAGKAIARLFAKPLAGDADSFDSVGDGVTYKRITGVSGGLAQTASLAGGAVTAAKVAAAQLDLSKLTDSLNAGLSFGDARNRLLNPGFESGSAYWQTVRSGPGGTVNTNSANARSGNKYLEIVTTDALESSQWYTNDVGVFQFLEVTPGDVLRWGCYANLVAGTGSVLFYGQTWDKDKAHVAYQPASGAGAGVYALMATELTVPAGTKYISFFAYVASAASTARFDDAFVYILPVAGDLLPGNLRTGINESGGKPINRLLAKPLAGDPDTLDSTADGTTYKRITGVSGGLVQTVCMADGAVTKAKTEGRSRCSVYHSANVNIVAATTTLLNWDSENFDVGALHSTTTNNSRITIPAGGDVGLWLLLCQVTWLTGAGNARYVEILKNGLTIVAQNMVAPSLGTNQTKHTVIATQDSLTAGDYFEVQVYHDSAAARTVAAQSWFTFFSAQHLW